MNTLITQDFLSRTIDLDNAQSRITRVLGSLEDIDDLLIFFRNYAEWNSYFAGGVARLVSNISASVDLFQENGKPRALADRSNYIASFFFDAARDEFDDSANRQRDPHRSMAQGFLSNLSMLTLQGDYILGCAPPDWLTRLCKRVISGYDGATFGVAPTDVRHTTRQIFTGIGYHLGSELLADQEFSIIDDHMRHERHKVFDFLKRSVVRIADADHRGYAWIGVHSGHGGAAEADHFDWALDGVNKALDCVQADRQECVHFIEQGFQLFDIDHKEFFNQAAKS